MEPSNTFAQELYEIAEESADRGRYEGPPLVHVIYGAGLAPSLIEWRIDLPLFLLDGDIGRLGTPGIALPQLAYGPAGASGIRVTAGGTSVVTQRVASIERVVAAEFEAGYGSTVSRAVAGAVLKAVAAAAVNTAADRAARQQGGPEGALIQILSRIGTSVAQVATTAADLRTWRLLPARYEVASFPAPTDGVVKLSVGGRLVTINLPTGGGEVTHFVFVRQVRPGATPAVRAVTVGVR